MTACEIMLHYHILYAVIFVAFFRGEYLLGESVLDESVLNENVFSKEELNKIRCISYCLSSFNISIEECKKECSNFLSDLSVNFRSENISDNNQSNGHKINCGSLQLYGPSSPANPDIVEFNWQFTQDNDTCRLSTVFVIQQQIVKRDQTTENWKTIHDLIIVDTMHQILQKLTECLYLIRVVAVTEEGIQAISNTVYYTAYPVPVNPTITFLNSDSNLDAIVNLTPHNGWEDTLSYWNLEIDDNDNVESDPHSAGLPKRFTHQTNELTVWIGPVDDWIDQTLTFNFEAISTCTPKQTIRKVVKVEYGKLGLERTPKVTGLAALDLSLKADEIWITQYVKNNSISVYVEWSKWKERSTYKPEEITCYYVHWGNVTNDWFITATEGEEQLQPDQFNVTLHDFVPGSKYGIQIIARRGKTVPIDYHIYNLKIFDTIDVPPPTTQTEIKELYMTRPQHLTLSRMTYATETSLNVTHIVIPISFLGALLLTAVVLCCRYLIKYRTDNKSLLPGEEMVLNLYETYAQNQSLCQQQSPAAPDRWEIPSSCLKFQDVLGEGAFGQVTKAVVQGCWLRNSHVNKNGNNDTMVVAVKSLHGFADSDERQNFLREIDLMKALGHHPNVVSLLACCTHEQPVCLVVEHCEYGDLLNYLRSHRNKEIQTDCANNNLIPLTPKDLLSFARQIALGMEYLSQKGFVHRDLAARNVLVADNKIAKIGDFGLTRYVYNDKIYLNRKGGKLPLKWMSIEAIFDHVFTSKSDIWSYGVLLSEIVTMGCTPYPAIHNRELLKLLQQGYRMERPENCSYELYNIMLSCWNDKPDDRPTFTDIRYHLEDMLEQGTPYVDVSIDPYRECFYHSASSSSSSDSIEGSHQTDTLIPPLEQGLTLRVPTEEELLEKKLQCLTMKMEPHLSVSKNFSADSGVMSDDGVTDTNNIRSNTKHSFV